MDRPGAPGRRWANNQADQRLAAEQTPALAQRTAVEADTAFEREVGFQAIAKVFLAAKAQARTVAATAGNLRRRAFIIARHGDAGVHDAVDGDAGLGMGGS
jgi:hypothetical protein